MILVYMQYMYVALIDESLELQAMCISEDYAPGESH
jgi:hypothetical protein